MEFLVRNFDSTNADPDADRSGCRKRGMVDAAMPDGHIWGRLEGLPRFVVVKCPGLTEADVAAYEGLRRQWHDNFDYEVTAQSAAHGWYDVRIYETEVSASGMNKIAEVKASKITGFLTRWGCSNIAIGDNQITFRIKLWDAVRSIEFWDITPIQFAQISFALNSYENGTANITVITPESWPAHETIKKITEKGGTLISSSATNYVFTITRAALLSTFKSDLKRKAERVYMFQRYRFGETAMTAAETAGGILTLSKVQLIAAIVDSMAE